MNMENGNPYTGALSVPAPQTDAVAAQAAHIIAEAIARIWGHIASGFTVVERAHGESTIVAYAWNLETNTLERVGFKVSHKRHTKKGDDPLTDDRDLYELEANNAARRLRACILALIPGDVVDAAVAKCKETLIANMTNKGMKPAEKQAPNANGRNKDTKPAEKQAPGTNGRNKVIKEAGKICRKLLPPSVSRKK